MGKKLIDESGNRYNRLYVMYVDGHDNWQGPLWRCLCDCGKYIAVKGYDLRKGRVKSCGCWQKEHNANRCRERNIKGKNNPAYKHGCSNTKEYQREHARIGAAKRRALQAKVEGFHTIEDLKCIYKHQQGKCLRCKKFMLSEKLTVDHVVPLTWGGNDYPSNIQLLCRQCNASKGNRHATDYRNG